MKIRTTILIGVAGLLLLVGLWTTLSILSAHAERDRSRSADQLVSSLHLAARLRQSSDDLTRMARLYVSTGEARYQDYFLYILGIRNGSEPRPVDYGGSFWDRMLSGQVEIAEIRGNNGEAVALRELMRRMGFTATEMALLNEAEDNSNDLVKLEDIAMNAVGGRFADDDGGFTREAEPDFDLARSIMYGERYHAAKEKISEPIDRFNRQIEQRLRSEMERLHQRSLRLADWQVMIALLTGSAMLIGLFHLRSAVLIPLRKLTRDARALRHRDYSTRVQIRRRDEMGELGETFNEMAQAISEDITNRDAVAVELRAARDTAEQAVKAKSEFLANMSHEIRTPMNGIMGMTDLLLGTELSKDQREYAGLINSSSQSLLTVINDILDFSKMEAGKMALDLHEFDLRDSIGDTLQTLGFRAQEKGLELAYQVQSDVPDCLIGDLGRVRQILVNLVSNAIKFTADGEVVVDVQLESQTRDQVSLHFLVKDTGIGISPDKLDTIFESFTQAEGSTTRSYGGTGLGLTISQNLVELMKGRIWVDSEPNQGSTFHFTGLFGLGSETEGLNRSAVETLNALPVLIVDDNKTNRMILQQMLKNWEMAPSTAASGSEALKMLAIADESDKPYQLVLLDVMMPEMDGLEVAARIGELYGKNAPGILVLSSAGQTVSADDAERLGIERSFIKPVKQSDLLDAITRLFGSSTRDEKGDNSAPGDGHRKVRSMTVLLAEDGRVNQMVAIKILEDRGHNVVLANDGQVAVELHAKQTFDAILMDVQMPRLDGYAATKAIRERENERGKGEHIAIVAMTANAMRGDREACLEAGMDDYLSKPVRSAELFAVLEKYAQAEADDAPGGGVATPSVSGEADLNLFDREQFRKEFSDPGLMRQLIDLFAEETAGSLKEAQQAIEDKNAADLHAAGHALKGTLGNYCAGNALRSANALDELGRGEDLAKASSLLADCVRDTAELHAALIEFRDTLK